jgi:predicted DNA-binding protein with PD1-like motif
MADMILDLSDGDDIMIGINRFAKQNEIHNGFIVGAVGAIKEFEMISHGRRGSVEKMNQKSKEFEVNAMSGKIYKKGSELEIKINMLISSTGFTPITGELIDGKVAGGLQITIRKVDLKKMIEA